MSLSWTSDEDLFARARRELFSAVIGDTLDLLGHRHQFLPPYAQDQRTRGTVVDFRCPVRIGRVDIRPGDTIFGDLDGVVVIPREIEAEVFEGAWAKAHGEKRVFEAIKSGISAQEAWDRYGIF
jgi:regulator of RNase E activity RraA